MTTHAKVIINADDFGLDAAVNEAVLASAEGGILSSATLMANMPGFFEATRGALSYPQLGVGVHLNLLRGSPVSDPAQVATLLAEDHRFLGDAAKLWWRFVKHAVDPAHVEAELDAQVRRVIDHGIKPTHLDSEKHLHLLLPQLWEAVCRVADRYDIPCVRVVREPLRITGSAGRPRAAQFVKAAVLNWRSQGFARVALRHRLRFADRFFGVAFTGRMTTSIYEDLFSSLSGGSLEIMCHPSERAETTATHGRRWLDRERVEEYRALMDVRTKEALIKCDATLINYGEL